MQLPQIPGISHVTVVADSQFGGPLRQIPVAMGIDEDDNVCLIVDEPVVISSINGHTVICLPKPD